MVGDTSVFAVAEQVANPFTVTTTAATGFGSLQQAIINVNADTSNPNADTITFAIATGNAPFILNLPPGGLPAINHPVIIDGTTQVGYSNTPIIVLDGAGIAGSGLELNSGSNGSTIKALEIEDFTSAGVAGIDILSSNDLIQSNVIASNTFGILVNAGTGDVISHELDLRQRYGSGEFRHRAPE